MERIAEKERQEMPIYSVLLLALASWLLCVAKALSDYRAAAKGGRR